MRTLDRNRPSGLFRGGERFRLMTMVVMLGVLLMLIYRASDPYAWRMFAKVEEQTPQYTGPSKATGVQAPVGESAPSSPPAESPPAAASLQSDPPQLVESPTDVAPLQAPPEAQPSPEPTAPSDLTTPPQLTTPEPEPVHPGPNQPAPRRKSTDPKAEVASQSPGVTGPTDEDPEERAAALEQFQAISDGATEITPEEMPTYWRMFRWVENQSLAELTRRAKRNVALNDFIQEPEVQRGQIVALDLNIRQVIVYPAPDNSAGIKKVYQVVGWTDQSKAWLYYGVTAHLPKGMPIGLNVNEKATMVGYFFKLQGYHPGGAGPKDDPLVAPLFVGRLTWKPSPLAKPVHSASTGWYWWAAGGLLVAIVAARWLLPLFWPSPARAKVEGRLDPAEFNRSDEVRLDDWLSRAQAGHIPPDPDNPDQLAEHQADRPATRYREN